MAPAGAPRVRCEVRLGANHRPWGAGALARALEPALLEAAGPEASFVSVSLEFAGTPAADAVLQVEAWVERATRTLVFAGARADADGRAVGSAGAVLRRAA